jgi:hypothetical protein
MAQFAFPETLVLSITTHGCMVGDKPGETELTKIPAGMTLTKISATAPGVPNMASQESSEQAINMISGTFQDPRNARVPVETIVAGLVPHLRQIQTDIGAEVRRYRAEGTPGNFANYTDKSSSVITYPAGSPIIDKVFSVSQEESMIASPYDFKINALNIPGKPDILRWVLTGQTIPITRAQSKREEDQIPLGLLLQVFRAKGVKKVILFDFSCSSMIDLDPRSSRLERRNLERMGLNGGRGRRKTNKKSTRRKQRNGQSKARTRSLPRHK